MKKYRPLFLLILIFYSCSGNRITKDNYIKDSTFTDLKGYPTSEYPDYFPDSIQSDSVYIRTNMDSFKKGWFSSVLYATGQPVLFNYYLGHPQYRFILLRSFDPPIVFTLNKEKGKVWIETRMLSKILWFWHQVVVDSTTYWVDPNQDSALTKYENKADTIKKADWHGEIKINQRTELTIKDWKEFEKIVAKQSFWTMAPYRSSDGIDGSQWIIEGHSKNKYWMVNRWSPQDSIREMGDFMIKKCGVKFESKGP